MGPPRPIRPRSGQGKAAAQCTLVSVTEELGWWVKGRFASGASFEFSCELWNAIPRDRWISEGVPITAMDVWVGTRCILSFLFGSWTIKPDVFFHPELSAFLVSVKHCYPTIVEVQPDPDVMLRSLRDAGYLGTQRTRRI